MCESSQISNDVKSKSERLVFNAQLKKHIQCTTKCVFVCVTPHGDVTETRIIPIECPSRFNVKMKLCR